MSAVLDRVRAAQWRVAMVVPLQGPAGLFGPSCEAIGELAVHDINNTGGVLGREAASMSWTAVWTLRRSPRRCTDWCPPAPWTR